MVRLRLVQRHAGLCRCRFAPHSMPLPSVGLSEPEALISRSFNPVLSGQEQTPLGDLHAEAGQNPKLNPRSCEKKEENGKSLPAASGAAD